MQKPFAINNFVVDDRSSFVDLSRANCTIKSSLEGGIGLPGAGAQLARRYGRWPIISGLQRPGSRLTLTSRFFESDKATQRRSLLAELNPEREIAARLLAADQVAPEGLIAAFGPWDVYADNDAAWHCRSLLWARGGDGELSPRIDADVTGTVSFLDGPNDRQKAITVASTTDFDLVSGVSILAARSILTVRVLARMPYDADSGAWPSINSTLWEIYEDGSNLYALRYHPTLDTFRFTYISGGAGVTIESAVQTFSAGDWLDLTCTLDTDGDGELYIDGVIEDTEDISAEVPITPVNWSLGYGVANDHGDFSFAEYDIFDRVLDANEIAQVATNGTTHLRARYLNVLCEASQPLVIGGKPSPKGNVSTLAIDGDVRWRSRDGDVDFWAVAADVGNQTIAVDSDDDVYPAIRITPGSAKDVGTGFLYKSPVLVEWKAPSSSANYPITFPMNTTALVGAGHMQGDLDDLRVYVGGLEVDRWVDSTTPAAATKVWINLDFSAHLELDLKVAIAGAGAITEIELDDDGDLTTLPASGLVLIDSEVFTYTAKNDFDRKLLGVTRAMRGTAAAAHTTADVVKWIQHDVLAVYGDSSLSTPVVDDDFEPMIDLSSSTNDSWVYTEFGEDDVPTRVAAWTVEIVNDPRPFLDIQSDFSIDVGGVSPWSKVGFNIDLYLGDTPGGLVDGPAAIGTGEGRWKVGNVCGITNALFDNVQGDITKWVAAGADAQMQSSEDGFVWDDVTQIYTGITFNEALDAGGADKWVAAWNWVNVANGDSSGETQQANVRVRDATLTLYNTLTPDTTVQSEENAYQFSATLTNETTGKALLVDFISDMDETLEIDTDTGAVHYLLDGTNQQQAVRQVGGAKRQWLELLDGDNAMEWDDTGTNDVDIEFLWHRRYWE